MKGFTLIELLVVVLIIGILAAVALPQYQVSVEKSRAANAIAVARAVHDAEELYFMANGKYTNQVDDLDIKVPNVEGFKFNLMRQGQNKVELHRQDPAGNNIYTILFSFSSRQEGTRDAGDTFYCAAYIDHKLGNRICSTYGPMFWGDSRTYRYKIN